MEYLGLGEASGNGDVCSGGPSLYKLCRHKALMRFLVVKTCHLCVCVCACKLLWRPKVNKTSLVRLENRHELHGKKPLQ